MRTTSCRLGDVEDATWDRVEAVNLTEPIRLSRAVLPLMLEAGGGPSSRWPLRRRCPREPPGRPTPPPSIIGPLRSIAFFYGPRGIRSNAVLPGPVAAGTGASAAPLVPWAIERAVLAMAAMPQGAQPGQLAATISWLACDEASDVNGAVLTCDSGRSAA